MGLFRSFRIAMSVATTLSIPGLPNQPAARTRAYWPWDSSASSVSRCRCSRSRPQRPPGQAQNRTLLSIKLELSAEAAWLRKPVHALRSLGRHGGLRSMALQRNSRGHLPPPSPAATACGSSAWTCRCSANAPAPTPTRNRLSSVKLRRLLDCVRETGLPWRAVVISNNNALRLRKIA